MISRFVRFLVGVIVALVGLALTGLIALDTFVPKNPYTGSIKGQALVLLWDRQSPLACTDNAVMVLENRTIERSFGPLVEASGHCQLLLENVRMKASRVVVARDDARVVIKGGRLEATGAALEVSGRATVQVEGAEVVGKIVREGEARLQGVQPR